MMDQSISAPPGQPLGNSHFLKRNDCLQDGKRCTVLQNWAQI